MLALLPIVRVLAPVSMSIDMFRLDWLRCVQDPVPLKIILTFVVLMDPFTDTRTCKEPFVIILAVPFILTLSDPSDKLPTSKLSFRVVVVLFIPFDVIPIPKEFGHTLPLLVILNVCALVTIPEDPEIVIPDPSVKDPPEAPVDPSVKVADIVNVPVYVVNVAD